jgi:hypothetical protein
MHDEAFAASRENLLDQNQNYGSCIAMPDGRRDLAARTAGVREGKFDAVRKPDG